MIPPATGDERRPEPSQPAPSGPEDTHAQGPSHPSVTAAVEAALRYLDDPSTALDISEDAPAEVRALLEAIAVVRHDDAALDHLTDSLATVDPPPLSEDPLAVALGLAAPEHPVLAGLALKAARQHARLKPSDLAARLAAAGHHVRTGQLLRWETTSAVPVDPAVLTALAKAVGVKEAHLRAASEPDSGLTRSQQFLELVKRWSRLSGLTQLAAQSFLLTKARTTAHRGTGYDDEAALIALTAFVEAHERTVAEEER